MRLFGAVGLALALALASPPQVFAQSAGRDDIDPAVREQARAHYQAGKVAFGRGDYETAIREYRAAHDLVPTAAMLFNLARAHELDGQEGKAISYYDLYLEAEPEGVGADEARRFRRRLVDGGAVAESLEEPEEDEFVDKEGEGEDEQSFEDLDELDEGGGEGDRSDIDMEAPEEESRPYRMAAWVLVGVGVVSGGLAIKFASDAARKNEELSTWDETWPGDLNQRIADADAAQRNTVIFTSVAAGALLTGVVCFAIDWRRDRPARVSLVPRDDGAVVGVTLPF